MQAIKRTDPDFFAFTVLNKVIGGGPSGRLFRHLREEKGYTYGAGSQIDAPRFRGTWVADTEVRTEVTEPALTDLLDELKQVRETPIPAKEFADAKRSLIASFALTLESPQALLNNAVTRYRFGLPATTGIAIRSASWRSPKPTRRRWRRSISIRRGCRSSPSAIRKALGARCASSGPVEVYDAEGRRITTY